MDLLKANANKFNCRTKVGNYPAIWLTPQTLTDEQKQAIFSYTYWVGLSAFIQNPSQEMEADIYEHLFGEDYLSLVFNKQFNWRNMAKGEQRVIAFLSSRNIGDIHYISGVCVDPALQGYGIGSALIDQSIKLNPAKAVVLRTQNPTMKKCFDKCLGGKSAPNGRMPSKAETEIAEQIAKELDTKNFNSKTFIARKVYEGTLYGLEPTSRDNYYTRKFGVLNKEKGDTLFCVKVF